MSPSLLKHFYFLSPSHCVTLSSQKLPETGDEVCNLLPFLSQHPLYFNKILISHLGKTLETAQLSHGKRLSPLFFDEPWIPSFFLHSSSSCFAWFSKLASFSRRQPQMENCDIFPIFNRCQPSLGSAITCLPYWFSSTSAQNRFTSLCFHHGVDMGLPHSITPNTLAP